MSLTEYRHKREFTLTREPEPGKPLPKGKQPIFVVQLRHASRRQYDCRLDLGDALKSWAVLKGPSFDPKAGTVGCTPAGSARDSTIRAADVAQAPAPARFLQANRDR